MRGWVSVIDCVCVQFRSIVMLEECLPGRLPYHLDIKSDSESVYYPAVFWTVVNPGVTTLQLMDGDIMIVELPMNGQLVMLDDIDSIWHAKVLFNHTKHQYGKCPGTACAQGTCSSSGRRCRSGRVS